MQSVTVARSRISADEAATVLRTGLGAGYQVEPDEEGLAKKTASAIGQAKSFRDDS